MALIPVIGIGYSYCTEIVYPIGAGMACGILQLSASIISSLITLGVGYALGGSKWNSVHILLASALGALVCGIVVKPIKIEGGEKLRIMSTSFSIAFGHRDSRLSISQCRSDSITSEIYKDSIMG